MTIDKPKIRVNEAIFAEAIKQDIFNNLNCIQVGQIDSFDSDKQTATVQIKMQRLLMDDSSVDYSPLVDCPCFCLSGVLGGLDIPISKGDTCIILFNDRSINEWWATNQNQLPKIYRTHDFSDAFILVGVRSLQNLIEGYLSDATRLWYKNSKIVLTDDYLKILYNSTNSINLTLLLTTILAPALKLQTTKLNITQLPSYANNTIAVNAGLVVNDIYINTVTMALTVVV